ncbi:hypothetical protein [Pseudomonas asplenii]
MEFLIKNSGASPESFYRHLSNKGDIAPRH